MRSLVRYSLIALGVVALAITVATFRPQLEQTTNAQVPGCDQTAAPSRTNKCLVISSFRENGPAGTGDEFIEIFNASSVGIAVNTLSDDPTTPTVGDNGIGVFSSPGQGTVSNIVTLRCQIEDVTIQGRGWFLCAGSEYSLSSLGNNGGTSHYVADEPIIGDIPDDAGLALLNIGTNIINACAIPSGGLCTTGFNYAGAPGQAVVLDRVGFQPYGAGSPANASGTYPGNIYPSFSTNYCEGTCLQPVGDASTTTNPCPATVGPSGPTFPENPGPNPPAGTSSTNFPVKNGGPVIGNDGNPTSIDKCYGESGQYKIERRRNTFSATAGDLHRDTNDNADDFILDAPNPSNTNIGQSVTGVPGVASVLGTAAPHNSGAPPILPKSRLENDTFDGAPTLQLDPRNSERRYSQDPNIENTGNDPLGTFILRLRYKNLTINTIGGARYRIDDLSMLCGSQTGTHGQTSITATQAARNLRGPNAATPGAGTPLPSCQEGGNRTAVLKGVNHNAQSVVDINNVAQFVLGSVLEDAAGAPGGRIQPWGAGSNSAWVANPSFGAANLGPDGVSNGTGVFGTSIAPNATIRIAFKFGVVKSGRFIFLVGVEGK